MGLRPHLAFWATRGSSRVSGAPPPPLCLVLSLSLPLSFSVFVSPPPSLLSPAPVFLPRSISLIHRLLIPRGPLPLSPRQLLALAWRDRISQRSPSSHLLYSQQTMGSRTPRRVQGWLRKPGGLAHPAVGPPPHDVAPGCDPQVGSCPCPSVFSFAK